MDPAGWCFNYFAMEQCESGADACAAFGAATGQYLTAFLGGHAGAKTVSTLALQYAWLECTFHGFS
jgi:hypothetical protein